MSSDNYFQQFTNGFWRCKFIAVWNLDEFTSQLKIFSFEYDFVRSFYCILNDSFIHIRIRIEHGTYNNQLIEQIKESKYWMKSNQMSQNIYSDTLPHQTLSNEIEI